LSDEDRAGPNESHDDMMPIHDPASASVDPEGLRPNDLVSPLPAPTPVQLDAHVFQASKTLLP
jgi:hypothetical protein